MASSRSVIEHTQHAYVTWVIKDSSYITGALVLGSSLRYRSPGIQRICLISHDINSQKVIDDLKLVYNYVIVCDLIYAEGRHPEWTRFENLYKGWINYCFTRLQCLRIGRLLGLSKIIILDADCLAINDLSELFELPTPAGILSLPEDSTLNSANLESPEYDMMQDVKIEKINEMGKEDQIQLLKEFKSVDGGGLSHSKLHGRKIPHILVNHAVATNYGIRGALMMLNPNDEDFEYLINILKSRKPSSKFSDAIGSYGDEKLHIGPDERLLTEALQKKYGWTHVHPRYCTTAWHLSRLKPTEIPVGLHFVSKKPWENKGEYFKDFDFWYLEALNLLAINPELQPRFESSYLSLGSKGRTSMDFSVISNIGLSKFWTSRVTRELHSSYKQNLEFQGRQSAVQSLTHREFNRCRVLVMPPHPLCLKKEQNEGEKNVIGKQSIEEKVNNQNVEDVREAQFRSFEIFQENPELKNITASSEIISPVATNTNGNSTQKARSSSRGPEMNSENPLMDATTKEKNLRIEEEPPIGSNKSSTETSTPLTVNTYSGLGGTSSSELRPSPSRPNSLNNSRGLRSLTSSRFVRQTMRSVYAESNNTVERQTLQFRKSERPSTG